MFLNYGPCPCLKYQPSTPSWIVQLRNISPSTLEECTKVIFSSRFQIPKVNHPKGHDIVKPNFSTSWHFRLRSLTIEGLISRCYRRVNLFSNWSACIALLSTIKSCKLESLTICLKNLNSADHLDWTALDDLLARDTFRNVKAMTFRIPTIIDHADSLASSSSRHHQRAVVDPADVAARLPGAHSRGILNFV